MPEVNEPVIVLGKTLVQSLRTSGLSYGEYAALAQQAGIRRHKCEIMCVWRLNLTYQLVWIRCSLSEGGRDYLADLWCSIGRTSHLLHARGRV